MDKEEAEKKQWQLDHLADIAWFIKGWLHADDCPFTWGHVESIGAVKGKLQKELNELQKEILG